MVEEELPGVDVFSVELTVEVKQVLRRVRHHAVGLNRRRNHQREHQVILLTVSKKLGEAGGVGSHGGSKLLVELGGIGQSINLNVIKLETRARSLGDLIDVDVVLFGARGTTIMLRKTHTSRTSGGTRFTTKRTTDGIGEER
jgi:hypothetical protein